MIWFNILSSYILSGSVDCNDSHPPEPPGGDDKSPEKGNNIALPVAVAISGEWVVRDFPWVPPLQDVATTIPLEVALVINTLRGDNIIMMKFTFTQIHYTL